MKYCILAGGKGSRLFELTQNTPKPLIQLAGAPILFHVAHRYVLAHDERKIQLLYGFNPEKFELILEKAISDSVFLSMAFKDYFSGFEFSLMKTSPQADTFDRIKAVSIVGDEDIMVTYGDTLTNINVKEVKGFWAKNRTRFDAITCVTRPPKRFSTVVFDKSTHSVKNFSEKEGYEDCYVGCGFIVLKSFLLNEFKALHSLESEVLPILALANRLGAFHSTRSHMIL